MDPKPNDELKADLELLLECLRCQEDNPTALKQALLTISSICATNNGTKEFFHESGGLQYVLKMMSTTQYLQVKESALYCLGCCVERNVFLQKKISTMSVFSFLYEMLTSSSSGMRLKQTASYLVLCIVANNSYGQVMAMKSGCLQGLIHLFRSVVTPESVMTGEDVDPACLHLWSGVTSALCMCVNNPQNDDNQRLCATLLPYAFKLLEGSSLGTVIRPVASFLGLMVANNVHNQDRVRKCGGLEVLVSSIQRLHNQGRREPQALALAIHLVNTLDSCISDNGQNAAALGDGDVIDTLLLILSEPDLDDQSQLQLILTLGHATDSTAKNQHKFMEAGGLPLLIQLMGESNDEEFSKAIKYVLQACVKSVKADVPPDKEIPITDQMRYDQAMPLGHSTLPPMPKQQLGLDNAILEKISELSRKLDSMENSSEVASRKLNLAGNSVEESAEKTVLPRKFTADDSGQLTSLLDINPSGGLTVSQLRLLMGDTFANPLDPAQFLQRLNKGHTHCRTCENHLEKGDESFPGAPTNAIKSCKVCHNAIRSCQDASKSCTDAPKFCQDAPISCTDAPKSCQDSSKLCTDSPKYCEKALKSCTDAPKSCQDTPSSPLITDTISVQQKDGFLRSRKPRKIPLNGEQKSVQQSAQKKAMADLKNDKKELIEKLKKEEERRAVVEKEAEGLREKVEQQTRKELTAAALREELDRQLEDAVVSSSSQGSDQSELRELINEDEQCSDRPPAISNQQPTTGNVKAASDADHLHHASSHSKKLMTKSSVRKPLVEISDIHNVNPAGHSTGNKSSSDSIQNRSGSRHSRVPHLAGESDSYSNSRNVSNSAKHRWESPESNDVGGITEDHLFVKPIYRPPYRRVGKENTPQSILSYHDNILLQSQSRSDNMSHKSSKPQRCWSSTRLGLQPVVSHEPSRNNAPGHLRVSDVDPEMIRGDHIGNDRDSLDESFMSDNQSEFDFHLLKKAKMSALSGHLGTVNISRPNSKYSVLPSKCPWSVKAIQRPLTSTPVDRSTTSKLRPVCCTEARQPSSLYSMDRDIKVFSVKPRRPKWSLQSTIQQGKERQSDQHMSRRGNLQDLERSSVSSWESEEEDVLSCSSNRYSQRCHPSGSRNSRCPGCNPAPSCSLPLLNSRTYNIALETHPYTCSRHREIRKLERQFVQQQILKRRTAGNHPSSIRRPLRLLRNMDNICVQSMEKTDKSGKSCLAVYDFSGSISDISEGDDLQVKRVTPPYSLDLMKHSTELRHPFAPGKLKLPPRKPRVPYSEEETDNLIKGVKTLGKHWNQILYTFSFHPTRTAVDLMEKYKRMMKSPKAGPQSTRAGSEGLSQAEPFSLCEERRLKRGVQKFGYNWKLILDSLRFSKGRTKEELRSKWRNLHRKDLTALT